MLRASSFTTCTSGMDPDLSQDKDAASTLGCSPRDENLLPVSSKREHTMKRSLVAPVQFRKRSFLSLAPGHHTTLNKDVTSSGKIPVK